MALTLPVRPSTVRLPATPPAGVGTVLGFFLVRFPRLPAGVWQERFAAGKGWSAEGPRGPTTAYRPLLEVHYRREVAKELPIRTDYRVIWRDPHLLVVDKPPFLPVTPGGSYCRHCLLHLLAEAGERDLAPLHRLDRLTSGLVVLSREAASRGHYARLFQAAGGALAKEYLAVCEPLRGELPARARLEHHVTRSSTEHWRQDVVAGRPANARLELELISQAGDLALYRVRPLTGRKHQIRVQLAHVGLPLVGDPLYGPTRWRDPEDLSQRLWLDAHRLIVTGFPAFAAGPALDADWRSAADPEAMLREALATPPRGRVGELTADS